MELRSEGMFALPLGASEIAAKRVFSTSTVGLGISAVDDRPSFPDRARRRHRARDTTSIGRTLDSEQMITLALIAGRDHSALADEVQSSVAGLAHDRTGHFQFHFASAAWAVHRAIPFGHVGGRRSMI